MIKEAILLVGLCQSLFAAFVLATKRKVSTSDVILVLCLVSIAFRFLAKIYSSYTDVGNHSDFTIGIIPLTLGPFLFLYTKYLTNGNPKFDKRDLWHFSPFLLFVIIYQGVFQGSISFAEDTFLVKDNYLGVRIIFALFFFTTVLLYTIFTYQQLYRYRQKVRSNKDSTEDRGTLLWLTFVITLFNLLFVAYFVIGLINTLSFSIQMDLVFIASIGLVILSYAISYFGIRQPSILEDYFYVKMPNSSIQGELDEARKQQNQLKNGKGSFRNQNIEVDVIVDRLNSYMESEKPYLNAELTLAQLADTLKVTKSQLTYILNNHLGMNFFSFVNNYRLKEVLKKLDDPSSYHLTILSIAFDCGFNSKSTFNSIFKQATGKTPSEYRKEQITTSE